MPWFADHLPARSETLQQSLFTVSSYSKLTHGLPIFTMFCNLPMISVKAIKSKWATSIRNLSQGIPYHLYDQYTLFSLSIYNLQSDLKMYEMLQGLYVRSNTSLSAIRGAPTVASSSGWKRNAPY
jgi:hypothetical protein